ncbi:hypothetical protein Droror1_Dr00004276 [Drosera rotundifolia]
MEGKKQVGSASSSFPSELFGTKDPSKTDVFSSIFPPQKVAGSWQKQQKQDSMDKNRASAYRSTIYKDKSSTSQEQRTHPCYLSSSIFYGGQEMYPQSSNAQNSGFYAAKEGEDYDSSGNNSNGASRGNWWEGSLYY